MDNHPQIDILSTPSLTCPNPVYNCIQYCFKANDYRTSAGTKATWSVTWQDATNYADGLSVEIADGVFETGPNDQDSFKWTGAPALTKQQIRDNCLAMMTANYDFLTNWSLVASDDTIDYTISGTAREIGVFATFNFIFDGTISPAPAVSSTNGTDAVYLDNYKVIVEIWTCDGGVLDQMISRNAYEPDADSLEFCIDISRNLSSFVSTSFPGLVPSDDTPIEDTDICQEVCLRFGQIYDEGVTNCDATPQFFELTTPITVINAAFQKPEEVAMIDGGDPLMDPFCYDAAPTRFLTDYPTGLPTCPDSSFWLWYNLDIDLTAYVNPFVYPTYRFFYTDGSNSGSIQGGTAFSGNGCWIVGAGEYQVGYLADPLKTIESIETTIVLNHDGGSLIISEAFTLQIDVTACCCREFYFLNEKGGFDTIRFNCEELIELNLSSSEVVGFENCEGDILKGGKAEADRRAFETFTVFSRFNIDYFDLDWFRQFLKSPIRYVRDGSDVYKIKLLTDSIPIYSHEEKIFVQLEYVLSYELNQQNI